MYILEEPKYFWLLVIIPVLVLVYLGLLYWKKRKQRAFANPQMLKELTPDKSGFKSGLKFVVLMLAFTCFILALVNPKIGTKMETVKREGVDIVFAIDVSKSMDARDVAPSRLEKSKQLVSQIINNLASDRVGIIAYAGSAFPQLPITTDFSAAKMFLQAMNTDMVSSQGTAINEAIQMATTYFDDQDKASKLLFIISDGEDHQGELDAVSEEAAKQGIKIFTIGVGTPQGGPIPLEEGDHQVTYKKDKNGETVITKLNETTLKKIASAGNGDYISGNVTSNVIDHVKEILKNSNKAEFETKKFADYKSQYQWFLALGILFLLLDIFLLERKTGWVKKLNLFNERKR